MKFTAFNRINYYILSNLTAWHTSILIFYNINNKKNKI